MRIADIIWFPHVIDKLDWKHNLTPEEVEEALFGNPMYRKVQRGHIPGEDLYAALGRTNAVKRDALKKVNNLSNEEKGRREN
jgi:hypothetical protein